jgi:two-component system, NtrC family, response regulator HydG
MTVHERPGKGESILIVDDDAAHAESTADCLRTAGYNVDVATSGQAGLEALRAAQYDLVLTDLVMNDMDGMEVLREALRLNPFIAAVVFTGYGTVENAVEAMKIGATDFILKPLNVDGLRIKVARSLEGRELRLANIDLRRRLDQKFGFKGIVGNSPALQRVIKKVEVISDTEVTVLIVGESGTGKELIARALHENGRRRNNRFIPVNCAAISPSLVESELFGHEKGAFTGATYQRKGRFEYANGGTIFLDEIGDMPIETQVKLLRVLEDGEVYRVGSNQPIKVDVRIISATNRNPEDLIREGRFREDLYWRLKGILIEIPPLRERTGDIPPLVHHYLREFSSAYGKHLTSIDREALSILCNYSWPGNVRELRNCIEEMVVVSNGDRLALDAIPERIHRSNRPQERMSGLVGVSLKDVERELIRNTLASVNGNRQEAARILEIGERTLYRKIKRYGLS